MFYTWTNNQLVKSGAANMSGFIGSKSPEESKYEALTTYGLEPLIYKKNTESFLVKTKIFNLLVFIKIDSLQGLMSYFNFSKGIQDISDYLAEDDDEEIDDSD